MVIKERFFRGVVRHKKLVLGVFMAAVIISGICRQFVRVNYDINDYLPANTPSTIAMDKMEAEFGSDIPNARVMVSGVTVPEAIDIKQRLEKIDGVTSVTWLDDAVDIAVPLEMYDHAAVEAYYKGNAALYCAAIAEDKRIAAVKAIRNLIGEDNNMSGTAVNMAVATTSTTKEILKITMIAIPFALFILLITTTSWFEPVIFLGTIGIAILMNTGTNIFFGEISFVTNAAGNILQLAVSLDYSVFLLHRFREIRVEGIKPEEAMVRALCRSTSSIASSGLTTVIGFLALTIMKFRIGPDLGFALAKGIAFSLLTVFILTPVLTLYCYRLIDKTSHRSFMPKFLGFGRFITKIMLPMAGLFFIIIIPSYLGSIHNDFYYGSSHIFGKKTQLGSDTLRIEEVFGKSDPYVLMVPKGNLALETELSDAVKKIPQVNSVLSYVDNAGAEVPAEYLEKDKLSQLISKNYSRMIINARTDYEGDATFHFIEELRETAGAYYPGSYYLAGESVSTYDLMDTITGDNIKVNLIAVGAVFIILLLSMRSLSLPFILVIAIETAVWFNFTLSYFNGSNLFFIGYLIISSVQLGATVDYAILMTDRYKEFRSCYKKRDAVVKTISVVTVSILTSGTAMTVMGFLLGRMTSHGVLSQLGYLLGKGTICSLFIVFFVLPGFLYLFDKPIQKTTKGLTFINGKNNIKEAL